MSQNPQGMKIPDGYSVSGPKDVLAVSDDGSAVPIREYITQMQQTVADLRLLIDHFRTKRQEAIDSACAVRKMLDELSPESLTKVRGELDRLVVLISDLESIPK
jgi:hypothetical protein